MPINWKKNEKTEKIVLIPDLKRLRGSCQLISLKIKKMGFFKNNFNLQFI